MSKRTPFERAMAKLDALHAEDPRRMNHQGASVAHELWHAGRMSAWLERVVTAPGELVRIAVRAQHLQRWQLPRSGYPEGRVGYLTWRRDQGVRAGETTAQVMQAEGYSAVDAAEVARMVRKQGLGRDPGTQAVEDCACLVFLESYFADFSKQVERDHLVRIVQKTWGKMSPRARELALALPMSDEARSVVEAALAS